MTSEVEMKEPEDGSDDRGHGNDGRDKAFEITISYNGLDKPLTVSRDELISSVLTRAIALYESLGFVTEGVRRNFIALDDGGFADDLLMARWLPDSLPGDLESR